MRKLPMILIGLLLLGGSLAMFSYRYVLKPQVTAGARSSSAPSDSAKSRSAAPSAKTSGGGSATGAPAGWQMAEFVLNGLNVVVGVLGIWMTWLGMRMQRQLAALQQSDGNRRV